MNSTYPVEIEQLAPPELREVKLPMGLLGFEQVKDYLLIANPEEEPFHWLQVKNNSALAFVVVDPFLVAPDYHPDIPQPEVEFLGLHHANPVKLMVIDHLHELSLYRCILFFGRNPLNTTKQLV